jgi:hypothetical protein
VWRRGRDVVVLVSGRVSMYQRASTGYFAKLEVSIVIEVMESEEGID